MIKKLLNFGLIYVGAVLFNNLVYINHPEYQQRPADLPIYISHPYQYGWEPGLPFSYTLIKHVTKRTHTSHPKEIKTPIEINRKFIQTMASIENPDGDPHVINQFGYMGKFQMGTQAFRDVGVKMSPRRWRQNPLSEKAQDKIFLRFCALNSIYLEKDIKKYSGKRIKGIYIHEANILAAAHGGIGRAHEFLASRGRNDPRDGNGTPISHYFKLFEHHSIDLSNVKPPTIEL